MSPEELEEVVVEVRLNLVHLNRQVNKLTRVLIEGDGKPPITERVAILDHKVETIEEAIDEGRTDGKASKAFWIGLVVSSLIGISSMVVSLV